MLAESYLERGIDGLARAFDEPQWSWSRFMDGHRGACVVASFLLSAEGLIEPDAAEPLGRMIDSEWGGLQLFAARTGTPTAVGELDRLLALMPAAVAHHGHVGHNVIYLTMALHVFARRPDLITAGRIDGLCTMARSYAHQGPTGYPAPPPFAARAFSTWLLENYLEVVEKTRGHKQGFAHMLTYAQAVVDLYALGYAELGRIAEAGLRRYVEDAQKGPSGEGAAEKRTDPDPVRRYPATTEYWRTRQPGTLEATFAHCPKYAYGLLKHLRQSGDPALAERAWQSYYLVIQP